MDDIEFLLHIEAARLGSDRDLRRSSSTGETVRIGRGVYVPTALWERLNSDERYRLLTHAALTRFPSTQASHDSAAALWRLPSLGPWPSRAHATVNENRSQRSTGLLIRHEWGLDAEGCTIDSIPVTSLARTVVDIARTSTFARAVGMADAALRGSVRRGFPRAPLPAGELEAQASSIHTRTGARRARRIVDFADARAESLGESVCRVQFHALGLPAPELQREFRDRQGRIIPDFYFGEFGLAIEFDGAGKYLRDRQFHPELSEAQIVISEKRRENRLRRLVRDVMRVEWSEAVDRRKLTVLLREHGVRV